MENGTFRIVSLETYDRSLSGSLFRLLPLSTIHARSSWLQAEQQ